MQNRLIVTLLLLSILLASCASIDGSDRELPAGESNLVKSQLARETAPQIAPETLSALVKGNTDFAFAFYDQIREDDSNIIFSPISLSLALSMTLAGADNTTQDEMLNALQFDLPEESVHAAINALLLAIDESQSQTMEDRDGSNFQLNIANSIWGQDGFDFRQDFLDVLARHYGAGIYKVDFLNQPEVARELINQWVEDETEKRIQDLIPPDAISPLTRLVLANAIYFNGSWRQPFSESGTAKEQFTNLDGTTSEVDMMRLSGERLAYAKGQDFQLVQLPYLSDDFMMTVIVPDLGDFKDFESGFDSVALASILENISYEEVNLRMPKYEFTTTINANDVLKNLGMAGAFDAELADFSGMTESEKLFISDVIHKADIKVDEKGTEAAAATAVIVGVESMMPGEPISLVIDRPFFFTIQHRPTGSILFMGRFTQP